MERGSTPNYRRGREGSSQHSSMNQSMGNPQKNDNPYEFGLRQNNNAF